MSGDHLSVARAIVDSMNAPRYDQPSGQRIKPGLEERTTRATEAIAYTTLAIAEELRAHRTLDRVDGFSETGEDPVAPVDRAARLELLLSSLSLLAAELEQKTAENYALNPVSCELRRLIAVYS